jgi:flavorubredoxin
VSLFGSALSLPAFRQEPYQVAPDTFVIRAATPSVGGTSTSLNSMVILAAEPVIVDTGMVTNRTSWFEDVLALVPPQEVRWIFISHNDSDHSGNLLEALERCPNAMVVTSRGESFRTAASFGIPFERMRMVDDGESFDVGDRTLRAVRPPVYDSPYTRGLFDPVTRIYYASDAFCAPMPAAPVDRVDEMPPTMWAEGMAQFHHFSVCPWIAMVDQGRFQTEVETLAGLGIETIVGAHTPVIAGTAVPRAFEQLAGLPSTVPAPVSFAGLFG